MTVDPLNDLKSMLKDNWSDSVTKPVPDIDFTINYRSLDLANKEYVLLGVVNEADNFMGIGASDYRRDIMISVVVKTAKSRERARELVEECRRIFRTKSYWGNYVNVLISRLIDLSDRERKIYTMIFDVRLARYEKI